VSEQLCASIHSPDDALGESVAEHGKPRLCEVRSFALRNVARGVVGATVRVDDCVQVAHADRAARGQLAAARTHDHCSAVVVAQHVDFGPSGDEDTIGRGVCRDWCSRGPHNLGRGAQSVIQMVKDGPKQRAVPDAGAVTRSVGESVV
jgi:hypothetical protein